MTRATRAGSRLQYVFPRMNFTLSWAPTHPTSPVPHPNSRWSSSLRRLNSLDKKAHYKKHVLNHVLIKLQVSHCKAHHSNG